LITNAIKVKKTKEGNHMVEIIEDERMVRRYLLGELAEPEQSRLEERLFTDEEFYKLLLVAEDELTDDYLRGDLNGQERKSFESYFLTSPERKKKLKFASTLKRYVNNIAVSEAATPSVATAETVPWWRSVLAFIQIQNPIFGLAAALMILVMGVAAIWLASETSRLRSELQQSKAERSNQLREDQLQKELAEQKARSKELSERLNQEQSRRQELEGEIAKMKEQPSSSNETGLPALLSFVLMPGLVRDTDQVTTLKIPSTADQLHLQLDLEQDDYKSYSAEIRSDDDNIILKRDNLKSRKSRAGSAVTLRMPAKILSGNSYRIILRGATDEGNFEKVGTYYFTVVR
jgi:hypothetical protein